MTLHERDPAQRFRRREPGGFEALYAEYGPRVYRFCRRLCGEPADAEARAQDVFVAALRGAEGVQGRARAAGGVPAGPG